MMPDWGGCFSFCSWIQDIGSVNFMCFRTMGAIWFSCDSVSLYARVDWLLSVEVQLKFRWYRQMFCSYSVACIRIVGAEYRNAEFTLPLLFTCVANEKGNCLRLVSSRHWLCFPWTLFKWALNVSLSYHCKKLGVAAVKSSLLMRPAGSLLHWRLASMLLLIDLFMMIISTVIRLVSYVGDLLPTLGFT